MEFVTVQNVRVPRIGLGTWPMRGERCIRSVATALDIGYRHLDTAQLYQNEVEVGEAIARSDVPREEIFLVTKIRRGNLQHDDVIQSVTTSHRQLGTHIDLLLIHAPSRRVPIDQTVRAMNALQSDGIVEHIGVSNFSVAQLEAAMDASETSILTNQVEYHPFYRQDELLAWCIEHDILLTAYSPLARGRVVGDERLREIGDRYGKSEAQVALRWLIQQEPVCAIPKAASRSHQIENLSVFDFSLTEEEMAAVFDMQGGLRDRLRRLMGL